MGRVILSGCERGEAVSAGKGISIYFKPHLLLVVCIYFFDWFSLLHSRIFPIFDVTGLYDLWVKPQPSTGCWKTSHMCGYKVGQHEMQ